jgi:hypothetical protein
VAGVWPFMVKDRRPFVALVVYVEMPPSDRTSAISFAKVQVFSNLMLQIAVSRNLFALCDRRAE